MDVKIDNDNGCNFVCFLMNIFRIGFYDFFNNLFNLV